MSELTSAVTDLAGADVVGALDLDGLAARGLPFRWGRLLLLLLLLRRLLLGGTREHEAYPAVAAPPLRLVVGGHRPAGAEAARREAHIAAYERAQRASDRLGPSPGQRVVDRVVAAAVGVPLGANGARAALLQLGRGRAQHPLRAARQLGRVEGEEHVGGQANVDLLVVLGHRAGLVERVRKRRDREDHGVVERQRRDVGDLAGSRQLRRVAVLDRHRRERGADRVDHGHRVGRRRRGGERRVHGDVLTGIEELLLQSVGVRANALAARLAQHRVQAPGDGIRQGEARHVAVPAGRRPRPVARELVAADRHVLVGLVGHPDLRDHRVAHPVQRHQVEAHPAGVGVVDGAPRRRERLARSAGGGRLLGRRRLLLATLVAVVAKAPGQPEQREYEQRRHAAQCSESSHRRDVRWAATSTRRSCGR